jgi:hypothetical protein
MRKVNCLAMVTACCFSGALLFGLSRANAMPLLQLKVSAIVPVASGCGLGVRRGPYERCDPIYYAGYSSGYRNNYYIGPVSGGVCGGRGTHLACNLYGICWIACNQTQIFYQ